MVRQGEVMRAVLLDGLSAREGITLDAARATLAAAWATLVPTWGGRSAITFDPVQCPD